MRQKRAKAYRKLMHLYCQSFGFRQPYQVLLDSETCIMAISLKIDIVKQLTTVLQGEVKPSMLLVAVRYAQTEHSNVITQCCIHELYLQGKPQQPATDLAKTFERRKCNHKEPIPGDDCLQSVVGDKNKHRYVITTQSHPLRIKLRTIPAAPIVHINRSVVVLEPPSDVTLQTKSATEEELLHATALDKGHISTTSRLVSPTPKKKRAVKGPNPLSVKKKKVTFNTPIQDTRSRDQASRAGVKRKQEDNEDQNGDTVGNIEAQGKQKRRRKHAKSSSQHEHNVQLQSPS